MKTFLIVVLLAICIALASSVHPKHHNKGRLSSSSSPTRSFRFAAAAANPHRRPRKPLANKKRVNVSEPITTYSEEKEKEAEDIEMKLQQAFSDKARKASKQVIKKKVIKKKVIKKKKKKVGLTGATGTSGTTGTSSGSTGTTSEEPEAASGPVEVSDT